MVILSIARRHLDRLAFEFDGPWGELARFTSGKRASRRRPYIVECRRSTTPLQAMFVFGAAAQKPFGTVDASRRREIGSQIRKAVRET